VSSAVSGHRAIIEVGPGEIRRLCCGASMAADADASEIRDAALHAIDDRVGLVEGRPVAVDALWSAALRSLDCATDGAGNGTVVVHPSWWSSSRVGVVTRAAKNMPGDVSVRPRSWLLSQASNADPEAIVVVVEIAERLVAIVGAETVGVPRGVEQDLVAEEVATVIGEMSSGTTAVVLIDVPSTVVEAPGLAAAIASEVRKSGQRAVEIDATRLSRLAASARTALPNQGESSQRESTSSAGGVRSPRLMLRGLAAAAVVFAAVAPVVVGASGHGVAPPTTAPTTFLVEGRVALTVPAYWTAQRVLAGPGSARVQVTSPADPEAALHVTQSPVPPDETMGVTADRLQRAIGSEPDGVFVDFNPSGISAGRPAVTYREVRASHQVRWTVVVDGPVRISIGCQSRPGGEDKVRDVCEQAVRSAHTIR
jgi:type VII secretion-associated protein (TIGR03931 family)